jgi:hypothetical protein
MNCTLALPTLCHCAGFGREVGDWWQRPIKDGPLASHRQGELIGGLDQAFRDWSAVPRVAHQCLGL